MLRCAAPVVVVGRVTEVADVVVSGNDVVINVDVDLPSIDRSQESTSSSCEFSLLVARVVSAVADVVVEGSGGVADDKLPIVDESQVLTSCPVWPDTVPSGIDSCVSEDYSTPRIRVS